MAISLRHLGIERPRPVQWKYDGAILPAATVSFLADYSKALTDKYVELRSNRVPGGVLILDGVVPGSGKTPSQLRADYSAHMLPAEAEPIAVTAGGDLIMMRKTGEVLWWRHDKPKAPLVSLATGLEAFVSLLSSEEPPAGPKPLYSELPD